MLLSPTLCMFFSASLCLYGPPDTTPKTPPNLTTQAATNQASADNEGKLPGKFAKLRPLVLLPMKALPAPLRSAIPARNEYGGAFHEGAFWFVWQRPATQKDSRGVVLKEFPWRMEIWRQGKSGNLSGHTKSADLQRLSVVTLDEGIDAPLTSGLATKDLSSAERSVDNGMAWLQPSARSGPIWVFQSREELFVTSFYVFPDGYDKPVVTLQKGGHISLTNTIYRLGEPDGRGFRVLEGEYSEPDSGGFSYDNVFRWRRYWRGKGWDEKGPDQETHEYVGPLKNKNKP